MSVLPLDDIADTADAKPGGALARGLRVLVALNDLETATISGLVAETGLAKPTVIRLLRTLLDEGYAAREPDTATYTVTPKVSSLSRALIGRNQTGDVIQSVLDGLADDLKWPTEYLVPEGNMMVIQSNNRERAHIRLKLFERRRFPFLQSAAGIAYLASLDEEVRAKWIARLVRDPAQRHLAFAKVNQAVENGYARRELSELAPHMCVMSVAVPDGGGALSLLFFDDVVTDELVMTRLLPRLRRAAEDVALAIAGTYPQ